ncbi:unnamed protein product [Amoebophrya sp. A120]|nr:unnamed protein product [Amoebophrya sp. A120]|eukprot:GSA120T00013302001.1
MGCGASMNGGAAAPAGGAAPQAAAPAAAPKAAAGGGGMKKMGPWTDGTGIQFWIASASHRDPIAIAGDVKCANKDLKKVVVIFDPRHLGFNKSFVTKVRQTLFKHKERTHGAADWNAVDTSAGYSADLKIRTLMVTATLNSKPEFCTAIEAGILGMAFLNTLIGSGWKGAGSMLKIACADDFYTDPDGVLYKLYGQYDEGGAGGKSSAWKAYCTAGKAEVDAMAMMKQKFEKDIAPKQAYGYLAENAGLEEKECLEGMSNLVNFIQTSIPTEANIATGMSTTRDKKVELPATDILKYVRNVTWPSNRRPVAFVMSTVNYDKHKEKFASQFFDRPVFNLEEEIPDGLADGAKETAEKIVVEKIINNQPGHHKRKPILIIGVDEVDQARVARFMCLMLAMKANPEVSGVTVIIHGATYESFTNNKLTGQLICAGLLLAQLCIVSKTDMLDRLTNMFLAPTNEAIVDSVSAAMVPFPGMHLMCTHNALGQEISDGGILTTEFMVANPGTGKTGGHRKMIEERFIDPVKFAATKSRNLVLSDAKGDKKLYRLRLATKYDYNMKPCSLIMPARIMAKLCLACAEGCECVEGTGTTAGQIEETLKKYAEVLVRVAEGGDFNA